MLNITTEKREIIGVLKTPSGIYNVLEDVVRKNRIGQLEGITTFRVVDDEGFDNYIYVSGGYVFIRSVIPYMLEVKTITRSEPELTKDTID